MNPTLDDLLRTALESGATVELELCDSYGYTFKIDGEPVSPFDKSGMPHETFSYELRSFSKSDELENLLQTYKSKSSEPCTRKHVYHYEDDGLGGHFYWKEKQIDEDNQFDESLNIGNIVLDFKDGRIAGFEVLPPAKDVIGMGYRTGSVDKPVEIEIETRSEQQ